MGRPICTHLQHHTVQQHTTQHQTIGTISCKARPNLHNGFHHPGMFQTRYCSLSPPYYISHNFTFWCKNLDIWKRWDKYWMWLSDDLVTISYKSCQNGPEALTLFLLDPGPIFTLDLYLSLSPHSFKTKWLKILAWAWVGLSKCSPSADLPVLGLVELSLLWCTVMWQELQSPGRQFLRPK